MKKLIIFVAAFGAFVARGEVKIAGTIATAGIASKYYSSLAKISITDATARAQARAGGKVLEATLESEDGYLVFSVELQAPGQRKVEVLVDAGDGRILQVEDDEP